MSTNSENKIKIQAENVNFYYGKHHAIKDLNINIYDNKVTAFIGPSGCGKSTFLRMLNKMNDLVPNTKAEGKLIFEGKNILEKHVDVVDIRKKNRYGIPETKPFSEINLPKHSLWA